MVTFLRKVSASSLYIVPTWKKKQLLYRYGLCSEDQLGFPRFELKHLRYVHRYLYGHTLSSVYPSRFGSEMVLWMESLSFIHDPLDQRVRLRMAVGRQVLRLRLESTESLCSVSI